MIYRAKDGTRYAPHRLRFDSKWVFLVDVFPSPSGNTETITLTYDDLCTMLEHLDALKNPIEEYGYDTKYGSPPK